MAKERRLIFSSAGQNLIPDDPRFTVDDFALPDGDLSRLEDLEAFIRKRAGPSQASSRLSQLSPGNNSLASESSHRSMVGFDFLGSAHSSQRFATPASLGTDAHKPLGERLALLPDDEGLAPVDGDLGFMVDDEGNVIELGEPELPPLLGNDLMLPDVQQQGHVTGAQHNQQVVPSEGLVIMGEEPLPDAEALDAQNRAEVAEQNGNAAQAPQPARRRRGRKAGNLLDDGPTFLPKTLIREWAANYVQSTEAASLQNLAVGPAKARSNALHFTFGAGIGNIGQETGLPGVRHPLAEFFAGDTLRDNVFGVPDVEVLRSATPEGSRRRRASEAFEEEEEGRRVRHRSEEGEFVIPDFDVPGEMGRNANQAVDPHSSMMPWSRQGSNVPGSAVKNPQRSRSASVTSLQKRSAVPDIERFSDPHLPSDNFAGGAHSSSLGELRSQHEDDSQWVRAEVERAAGDFLAYAAEKARGVGNVDGGDGWVSFEDLVVPGREGRRAAACGFYHVLALATRGRVRVWQEGVAFGRIEVGVEVGGGI